MRNRIGVPIRSTEQNATRTMMPARPSSMQVGKSFFCSLQSKRHSRCPVIRIIHAYRHMVKKTRRNACSNEKMQISENGVASLYITKGMKKKFKLSNEEASATVSCMDSIKGSLIWIAFIENGDGSIRVRLRSRFVAISDLASRYRGGGHACACGATLHSKAEVKALLADADKLLKEYKERNKGWL